MKTFRTPLLIVALGAFLACSFPLKRKYSECEATDEVVAEGIRFAGSSSLVPLYRFSESERGVVGWVISGLDDQSQLANLGLIEGDIIRSVNGQNLDSAFKAGILWCALGSPVSAALGVERKGNTIEILKYPPHNKRLRTRP